MSEKTHEKIRKSFGRASNRYDQYAFVQQQVSDRLAKRLQHVALPFAPKILEIGAGTGALTRKLQKLWGHADYVMSDISWQMMSYARSLTPRSGPKTSFVVMDAHHPAMQKQFDLIVSSMTLHWLQQPLVKLQELTGLLQPGGIFSFAMLAENSFRSWRHACMAAGVPCGLWDYPTLDEIKSIPGMFAVQESMSIFYDRPEDFLYNLKNIGAGEPNPNYRRLSSFQLKSALAEARKIRPFVANYEVVFAAYHATKDIAVSPNISPASTMA